MQTVLLLNYNLLQCNVEAVTGEYVLLQVNLSSGMSSVASRVHALAYGLTLNRS